MASSIPLPLTSLLVLTLACGLAPTTKALAQGGSSPGSGTVSPAPSTSAQTLKPEELDQLVAQIALYPDTLLSQILMASTYPLEVISADRWVKANKNLKGEQLKAAVGKQPWEDSVKALAATPPVLDMMSQQLDWTQKLGDAVLAQQPDVMEAIQRLRNKADAQNTLKTTKEQKVTKTTQQGKQVIVIEPTNPSVVYVPSYNPTTVYGAWPYPAYPPYAYPPYGGYLAGGLVGFGVGMAVGAAWGGGFGWGSNNINVNRSTNIVGSGNNWNHKVEHRGGARYNNKDVANKFGRGGDRAGGAQGRMDFRGHGGQQVLKPGGDRPGGDRPGGDRAGAGNRPGGDRAGAGNRPGGDRAGAGRGPQQRPSAGARPGGGGRPSAGTRPSGGGNALGNMGSGRNAMANASRGHASLGGRGGGGPRMGAGGGGGFRGGGGGGGFRGGGGGGRGGGGRRSDIALKQDITLIGVLDNGLGFYRFVYTGGDKAYVGVMAQEVQTIRPDAVLRGRDGYLRVRYDKLGLKFQAYEQWMSSGAHIPAASAAGTR